MVETARWLRASLKMLASPRVPSLGVVPPTTLWADDEFSESELYAMSDSLDPRHAVCVGSFDPVTLGHVDIIARGSRVFDRLTVGIGINPDKNPLFSLQERLSLMRRVLADLPNIEVLEFDGLAVNFVREQGAAVLLRGVRSLMDIESELTMSLTNRTLAPEIETVFLMANENYSHISSTLIKQIARFAREEGHSRLESFVPIEVVDPLLKKFRVS